MLKKLNNLLEKYNLPQKINYIDKLVVEIDNKKISLLSWRFERRFIEFKKVIESQYANGISAFKIHKNIKNGQSLYASLSEKIDLSEWILQTRLERIFCIQGKNVLNAIVVLENKCVCTIELAISDVQLDKHEIITRNGIVCDKVVDTQIPQDSIYLYSKLGNKTFTDIDFELYGADFQEIASIRAAFALVQNAKLQQSHNIINDRLIEIQNLAIQSAKNLDAVNIGGLYEPH